MYKHTILFILLTSLVSTIPFAWSKTRHCDANYAWETTGGSIGPVQFEGFSARGHCTGNANNCRKKAKNAILRCARTNWENRWKHHPFHSDGTPDNSYDREKPEACVNASHVKGYNLTETVNGQKVSETGDIKSRLEAEVCCIKKSSIGSLINYQNNQAVHVRLLIQARSGNYQNKFCEANEVLSPNYKINCAKVRQNICPS